MSGVITNVGMIAISSKFFANIPLKSHISAKRKEPRIRNTNV